MKTAIIFYEDECVELYSLRKCKAKDHRQNFNICTPWS